MYWIKPEERLPEPEEFVVGMRDNGKWEQLQYLPNVGWATCHGIGAWPPLFWCRVVPPGSIEFNAMSRVLAALERLERKEGEAAHFTEAENVADTNYHAGRLMAFEQAAAMVAGLISGEYEADNCSISEICKRSDVWDGVEDTVDTVES